MAPRKHKPFKLILSSVQTSLVFALSLWLFACSDNDDTTQPVYQGEPAQGNPTPDPDSGPVIDANTDVRFIAVGDVGKGNQEQYQVAAAMKEKCIKDECDFILMLGDNIYNDGVSSVDDSQFQTKFELPYQDIQIPFYVALGNHDYGGNGKGTEYGKAGYQIDYTNVSSKWKMPHHYYQFEQQNVTFIALDTNGQMFGIDKSQQEDVSSWIANSTSQWKIVFGHHPYLSNGPHGNAGEYEGRPYIPIANGENVKQFAESVWCGKVDLYLAGHDHSRQWLADTCQGTGIVVSGAGSSTTDLPGSNSVLFQENTLGFLYIHIQDNILNAEFIDVTGNVNFRHTITK